MNTHAYEEGFDRGADGSSTPAGFFDGWFDGPDDEATREEGWKAGMLAREIRGDD